MMKINKLFGSAFAFLSILGMMTACTSNPSSQISNNDSSEQASDKETSSSLNVKDEDATVDSVNITIAPKSEYVPGDIFDITGLTVDVNLSNGHKKNYMDGDFVTWTHKDEPLTTDISKITFAIPDRKFAYFDMAIKVAYANDVEEVTTDLKNFNDYYHQKMFGSPRLLKAYEIINFTRVVVKAKMKGDTDYTDLKGNDWTLYEGEKPFVDNRYVYFETVGDHTLTARYHGKASSPFVITISANEQTN